MVAQIRCQVDFSLRGSTVGVVRELELGSRVAELYNAPLVKLKNSPMEIKSIASDLQM